MPQNNKWDNVKILIRVIQGIKNNVDVREGVGKHVSMGFVKYTLFQTKSWRYLDYCEILGDFLEGIPGGVGVGWGGGIICSREWERLELMFGWVSCEREGCWVEWFKENMKLD